MSCCCNNYLYGLPCCCPPVVSTSTTTTTTTCLNGEPCDEAYESDCVIYNGDDLECYGIIKGMTITDIIGILISLLPQCTTTTTTTTSTTTTTTSSTTTTTTAIPCNCYTITNGDAFIYTLTYTDCNGVVQSGISVDPAETINFCAQVGSVVYNGPGGDITDNGDCLGNPICTTTTTTTTAAPCTCYTITNSGIGSQSLSYLECSTEALIVTSVAQSETINFCAVPGSIIYGGNIGDITDNGACASNPICAP